MVPVAPPGGIVLGEMSTVAPSPDAPRDRTKGGQHPTGPEPAPPSIDGEGIARALTDFVNANIMARGRAIAPGDDLEAAGVDSLALLKILLFIEAEFGFWMPDEDLVEANIASARALARYICGQRGPS